MLDAGFMTDRSDFLAAATPDAKRLCELADIDCLVLIGEPGLGKTTELKAEYHRVDNSLPDGDRALLVELGFTRVASELEERIFGSDAFREWSEGEGRLHLFLDSLDEARLRLETAAKLLIRGLEDVPHQRLVVRLSCRSADRHQTLENELSGWFGGGRFAVRELAPLTRSDVEAAAAAEEVDPEKFIDEVVASEVQSLAMVPESLKFLLGILREGGTIPPRRSEAFEQGLELLCREPDEDRRTGQASPSSRMAISARIAAATLLSGRSVIRTAPGSSGPDEAALAELVGGREVDRHVGVERSLDIDEAALEDALGTAIFSGAGPGRSRFAQASHSEFLAARWIADGGLSTRQRDDLLFAAASGKLVPQLREVAVSLAELSAGFEATLLDRDPLVLLRSEPRGLDNGGRERAVEALMEGARELAVDRWDNRLRRSFSSLAFPGIVDLLRSIVGDGSDSPWARQIACDLAAGCGLVALAPVLIDLALDPGTHLQVRVAATSALGDLADKAQLERIRPLAIEALEEDEDDELKAAALRILWPQVIGVEQLVAALTGPKRDHYVGAYRMFLASELVAGLKTGDLPTMLRWAAGVPVSHFATDELSTLREEIFVVAWPAIVIDDDIREAFLDALVPSLRENINLISNSTLNEHPEVFVGQTTRRSLLRGLVPLMAAGELTLVNVLFASPGLLAAEDGDWLVEELRSARGSELERPLAELIDRLPVIGGSELTILEALGVSTVLDELSASRFGPVRIDSPEAEEMRHIHAVHTETRAEEVDRPESDLEDLDIPGRVKAALDDYEGGDRDGFWVATKWMEINERRHREYLISDLTAMSGWSLIDDVDRRRLLDFAPSYLREGRGEPEQWFRQQKIYWPDWAAYRALRLLADRNPDEFARLGDSVWESWAAVIVGWFRDATVGSDETAFNDSMLQHLFTRAPRAGAARFAELLDRDLRAARALFSLHLVERVWAPELEKVILRRAKRPRREPERRAELLRTLIANGSTAGLEHARRLVVPGALSGNPDRRALAAEVAMVLLEQRGAAEWERIWKLMRDDVDLGRDLVTRLAVREVQIAANLPAALAAELYLWVEHQFPSADDPHVAAVHSPSPRERIGTWRWRMIGVIAAQGTREAIDTLARLARMFPEMIGIKRYQHDAEEIFERTEWEPPRPGDVVALSEDSKRRYVRSDRELREVLIFGLERCQEKLQGQEGVVSLLWDSEPLRPKRERQVGLWLADRLKEDLTGRGIFVGRELEIKANPKGYMGESVDIICEAVAGERVEGAPIVRVVIELKCCWHADLDKAMKEQLVDRYLDGDHRQGIYVVAQFDSPEWDDSDSTRRRRCRQRTLEASRVFFAQQAQGVSADGMAEVSAYILDCSL
jgi:hypothetical protein